MYRSLVFDKSGRGRAANGSARSWVGMSCVWKLGPAGTDRCGTASTPVCKYNNRYNRLRDRLTGNSVDSMTVPSSTGAPTFPDQPTASLFHTRSQRKKNYKNALISCFNNNCLQVLYRRRYCGRWWEAVCAHLIIRQFFETNRISGARSLPIERIRI